MNLDDVRKIKVARQKKHRVGRGDGSGWGVTAGRGHKGAGQRSGTRFRLRFEGGQMPIYRRLPKKGFTNHRFKTDLHAVNVGQLDRVFEAGEEVDLGILKARGLAPKRAEFVKILGHGDLTKGLTLSVHGVSAGARQKIEKAGGTLTILPTSVVHRPKFEKKPSHQRSSKPARNMPTKSQAKDEEA